MERIETAAAGVRPAAARFDTAANAWVLSRHADVLAALRDGALHQTFLPQGGMAEGGGMTEDDAAAIAHAHAEVQGDLGRLSSAEWRMRMEAEGRKLLSAAAAGSGPVELVGRVIQPWSAELAVGMSGAEGDAARRLRRLARIIFYKQEPQQISVAGRVLGYPRRRVRGLRRAWAMRALTRMLERRELPMGRSTFAGVTQTLPSFIAKSWLALLQHPEQMERLRLQPEIAAGAAEELLRYAGIVHTLHRHASREVTIGEARIAAGQRVLLRLGDANFDPEKFVEPERLDLGRAASGQLALGRGLHACVGAVVARIGASVMLPLLAEAAPVLERGRRVAWIEDSSLRWPRELWVRFAKR